MRSLALHKGNLLAGALLALAVGSQGGCAAVGPGSNDPIPKLGWPPDDPRVMFEGSIARKGDIARRSALSTVIKGRDDAPLFGRPFGLAWDGDALVVTDPGEGRVIRLEASGKVVISSGFEFEQPMGVAVCDAGVVITDSRDGSVVLLDNRLRFERLISDSLNRPTGVACAEGRILVVETGRHRIVVFAEDGSTRVLGGRGQGRGEFNFPTSIMVADGEIWVGDALNFRLQRFKLPSGEAVGAFGEIGDSAGEMPRVKDLAMDGYGNIWVSDAHLDVVALFSIDGSFLMSIGRSGSGPGEFAFPSGVAAHPDGRVAVSDSLNQRIQMFRLLLRDEETND